MFESKPGACNTQRYGDDKPDDDDDEHGTEWHCSGCPPAPEEQIEEEKGHEDDGGHGNGRVEEAQFPRLAVEELVSACRSVAAEKAEESIEDDDDRPKSATVARGKEAKEGKDCSC